MFKDTKEELERLESVLLDENADEAPTEVLPAIFDDNTLDALLSEDHGFGNTKNADIYKNFSNGYGASEDEDEEEYESDIEPARDPVVTGLTVLALVLVAGILGVLLWALITFRGLL